MQKIHYWNEDQKAWKEVDIPLPEKVVRLTSQSHFSTFRWCRRPGTHFSTFRCRRPGRMEAGTAPYLCSWFVMPDERNKRLHDVCHQRPVISLRLHTHGRNGSHLNDLLHWILPFQWWIHDLYYLLPICKARQSLFAFEKRKIKKRSVNVYGYDMKLREKKKKQKNSITFLKKIIYVWKPYSLTPRYQNGQWQA